MFLMMKALGNLSTVSCKICYPAISVVMGGQRTCVSASCPICTESYLGSVHHSLLSWKDTVQTSG